MNDVQMFWTSFIICSIIVYGSVCWGGNISKFDRGRLEKIVKQAGQVVEMPLDSFTTLCEKRLFKKLLQVLNNSTHPMKHYFNSTHSKSDDVIHRKRWREYRFK